MWLITGGFPCQPFSCAGKRRGKEDDRYIWPEMLRVIAEAGPTWVLAENVPGIINMELDSVLSDLEGIGYSAWPIVVPACAVDARHRRDRVWIVAHSNRSTTARQREHGGEGLPIAETESFSPSSSLGMDARRTLLQRRGRESKEETTQWCPEPNVGRVANGVPRRVDRLKGLGNSIVPKVAAQIIKSMIASEETI